MELKKRIVTVLVGLVLFVGTAVPKARADEISGTLTYGGGFLVGLGIGSLIIMPEEKGLGIGCLSVGTLMIIGGLWYAIANDESIFAKAEQNPVIQHVRFGTTGSDFSLGAAFKL